jgi:hypothetical protein
LVSEETVTDAMATPFRLMIYIRLQPRFDLRLRN